MSGLNIVAAMGVLGAVALTATVVLVEGACRLLGI